MLTTDQKIELKIKQDKINLIKDIAAGRIEPEVAKFINDLLKKGDRCIWLVCKDQDENTDYSNRELLPEYKAIKELYDKIPEKYKSMFYVVQFDEQDLELGKAID
jgi:thiamine monophosphate synthase